MMAQVSEVGFACDGEFLAPTASDSVTQIEQACDRIGPGIVSDRQAWPQESTECGCAAITAPSRHIPIGSHAPQYSASIASERDGRLGDRFTEYLFEDGT